MERKTFALLMLLLIVLASQDKVVMKVEGRVCESQSHGFKGPCSRNHNCALVCRNEGFSGGRCRGFRRRCFCTKLCTTTTN
ncbi:defensin-like protein 1 [Rhododendron vialii]|nr:defensin-like protein 1 [Rhododendron vialii]